MNLGPKNRPPELLGIFPPDPFTTDPLLSIRSTSAPGNPEGSVFQDLAPATAKVGFGFKGERPVCFSDRRRCGDCCFGFYNLHQKISSRLGIIRIIRFSWWGAVLPLIWIPLV